MGVGVATFVLLGLLVIAVRDPAHVASRGGTIPVAGSELVNVLDGLLLAIGCIVAAR